VNGWPAAFALIMLRYACSASRCCDTGCCYAPYLCARARFLAVETPVWQTVWLEAAPHAHTSAALVLYFVGMGVSFPTPHAFKWLMRRSLPPSCIFLSWSSLHASIVTDLRAAG
jgi:hypothetical protein